MFYFNFKKYFENIENCVRTVTKNQEHFLNFTLFQFTSELLWFSASNVPINLIFTIYTIFIKNFKSNPYIERDLETMYFFGEKQVFWPYWLTCWFFLRNFFVSFVFWVCGMVRSKKKGHKKKFWIVPIILDCQNFRFRTTLTLERDW